MPWSVLKLEECIHIINPIPYKPIMILINTLTRTLQHPRIRPFLALAPQFSTDKDDDLIDQYNEKLQKIRLIKNSQQRSSKFAALVQEMRKKFKDIEREDDLEKIKGYLMEGFKEETREKGGEQVDDDRGYIPANLVVKKLKFLDKKILMLGVEEENEDHCIYLKQMAQKMNTKIILTALPPDMPYFIKTQLSFAQEWKKFLTSPERARQSKFYLNPSPHHISQFSLQREQIQLVRDNLNKSKEFNEIFYTVMQYNKKRDRFLPNALLTPLLVSSVQKVYFCDYPVLKEREFWALAIPLEEMRNLFKIYHREYYKEKDMIFDPRILFPKEVINRKFEHMANAIKFSTHETKQPSIFVCPAEYCEQFISEFKKNKPVSQFSDFSFNLLQKKQTTFIDFIEKLAIMDIILQPVIDKYFIKNVSFPYSAQQTLGGRENIGKVFMVWNHFTNVYRDALAKEPDI